ncbi:28 kDa ribonucleoprotein, chloroplastic-like isoform X4 [Rhododendron vialii]|uniref:28 kDa ribonucleoprotein, chloroplastic-like isoform X4 n=1 Tax=Rhododendron vialii TaxID=182163 RepID=UPI00265F5DF1|nr:28 kDa ribonucleoprotein, chloroplastic-like isoform X4 [Rhododendron vialii]XP_058227470.1 28 kDa ribonucleoprotein, chloroplastic-like isoform X4 [Rhododendron vialii]
MSCSVKPVYKSLLSSAPNGCLFSLPAIFTTTKTSFYQDLSKPIKIHLSLSHSKLPFPFFSTNSSRTHSSTTVSASEDKELGVRLYVGNLEYGVDSEKLAQLFQQAGVVEVAEVMYYRETGEPRGFRFIKMSTVEEADKAMEMFHRFDLNGRSLIVRKATPRGTSLHPLGHKIFVSNLPFDVDDERLEQLFSEHGKVVNARIVYDANTQHSRGIGFVAVSTEAEMNDAIANLN